MKKHTTDALQKPVKDSEFEDLYNEYRNRIYRFTTTYTRNRDEQDELVQEIFYNIYLSLPKFKGKSSLSTYIYAIARNTCLKYIKKDIRQREKIKKMITLYEPVLEKNPYEVVMHSEEVNYFLEVVESLPQEFREVFFLFEMEGMRYRQISQVLDLPVGTVKSRLNRAKERIVDIITKEGKI